MRAGRRSIRRRRGERGASLIESAVVMPVFVLLLMGLFEMGLAVHNYIKVDGAANGAVRALTVDGAAIDADYVTLQTLRHGLSSFDVNKIESMIVFKADGTDSEVPAACRSIPIPAGAECNTYQPSDFFLAFLDDTGAQTGHWGCGSTAQDQNWCPTGRQDALSDPGGPDYVGIYIRVTVPSVTGMIGPSRTLEVTRIARIEPAAN